MAIELTQQPKITLALIAELLDALGPWRTRLAKVYRLSVEAHCEKRYPQDLGPFAPYSETAADRRGAYLRACKGLQDDMLDADVDFRIERAFEALADPCVKSTLEELVKQTPKGTDDRRLFTQLTFVITSLKDAWVDGEQIANRYGEKGMRFFWAAMKGVGLALNRPQGATVELAIKDLRREPNGMGAAGAAEITQLKRSVDEVSMRTAATESSMTQVVEVLIQSVNHLVVERQSLTAATVQQPARTQQQEPHNAALKHSADFTTVSWFGTTYSFNKTQAACVRVLWTEWMNGTNGLGEETIGERIGAADATRRFRLDHVFRSKNKPHPAWKKMIVSVRKGVFGLAEPESPQNHQ